MGAPEVIIREADFAQLLGTRAEPFLRYLNLLLRKDPADWFKRHYVELVAGTHDLETFLDDHGAANNQTFAQVREWVACLRGLGRVAVSLEHLVSRLPRYHVELDAEVSGEFFAETNRTARFLQRSVHSLVRALLQELKSIGVPLPSDHTPDSSVPDGGLQRQLPHDIDASGVVDERRRVAEVATMFLEAVGEVRWLADLVVPDPEERRSLVLQKLDEERSRYYEGLVHSLQSKYDTWVGSTKAERDFSRLLYLRGHASMSLHLLEMATELVHFYVRHENDVRSEQVRERVAEVIDKEDVVERAIHYAFRFAGRILVAGVPHAEEALRRFAAVGDLRIRLEEGEALHARPISLIVRIAQHHGTRVEMEIEGEVCSASSIMEMILLAGSRPDVREIVFRGEEAALRDIELLFEHRFGEDGLESLPDALAYLRER